jgi:hypothetical protein
LKSPDGNIQHPTSNIQHPTFNIQHSTSNIQHPTFNIQHPTSNIQHPMRGAEGLGVGIGMFWSFNDRVALGGLNAGEENQALGQVNDSRGETKESFFEIEDPLVPGALVQPTNLSPRSIGCWMLDVFSVSCSPFLPFPIGSCFRVSESKELSFFIVWSPNCDARANFKTANCRTSWAPHVKKTA